MTFGKRSVPGWYWVVSGVLALWALMGIAAFYGDIAMTDAARAALPEWDRQFMAARPGWFLWAYGIAVWAGLAGALALLLRRGLATLFYAASLVALLVQFGYVFLATDLVAAKGAMATLPFPLVIVALGAFSLWFARHVQGRGWLR